MALASIVANFSHWSVGLCQPGTEIRLVGFVPVVSTKPVAKIPFWSSESSWPVYKDGVTTIPLTAAVNFFHLKGEGRLRTTQQSAQRRLQLQLAALMAHTGVSCS